MTPVQLASPLVESRQAAVARLAYAVQRPGAVAVLCGPAGTGVSAVLAQLADAAELGPRQPAVRRLREWDGDAAGTPLPAIVLADDADDGDGGTIRRLLDRCRRRQPAASLVLGGHGRLLSLIGRDTTIERCVLLRAVLRPFSLAETRCVLDRPADTRLDDAVIRTVHELAAGIPASVHRLAELAGIVAAGRPDNRLSTRDVEAVHRRLCPRAA